VNVGMGRGVADPPYLCGMDPRRDPLVVRDLALALGVRDWAGGNDMP
jgi:hypothetical protein